MTLFGWGKRGWIVEVRGIPCPKGGTWGTHRTKWNKLLKTWATRPFELRYAFEEKWESRYGIGSVRPTIAV
jgi:hypothetical protein